MRRLNLIEPGRIVREDVPVPEPREHEMLIRTAYVGICGSDLHAYHGTHPFIACPIVPGHEFSGFVARGGELPEGTRVTVVPQLVCGQCYPCRTGRYNICQALKVLGCQSDGAMADFVLAPADKVVALPEEVPLDLAALIEPLAVGHHALTRGDMNPGDRVLIFGAGVIGLLAGLVAKALGAGEVALVDVADPALERAARHGIDHTINSTKTDLRDAIADRAPDGFDLVLECVGCEDSARRVIEVARKGSTVVIVGVFPSEPRIDMARVQDAELSVVGSLMYWNDDYEAIITLLRAGMLDVKDLITHVFPFEDYETAFATALDPSSGRFKVTLQLTE